MHPGPRPRKRGTISRREIREALHVPDSTVRRWLQDLVDFEYLGLAQAEGEGTARARPSAIGSRP